MPRVKLGPSTNELTRLIRQYANEAERSGRLTAAAELTVM